MKQFEARFPSSVEIPPVARGRDVAEMMAWCRGNVGGAPEEAWAVWHGTFLFRDEERAAAFRRAFIDRPDMAEARASGQAEGQ
jgi:hypothetical protein